jgi:penicillin amidase
MRFLRIAGLALGGLLFILVLLLLAYRVIAQPATSGTVPVDATLLPRAVTVERDRDGIPTIRAQTLDDAWFAMGYVHGQDRLWQLEMNRRIASGQLAEVLGPGAAETDKFLRTLGVARAAKAQFARLDAATQQALRRYADGVNAAAAAVRALPPEFLLLGFRPGVWQPEDSVAWSIMMAWDLGGNWSSELLRLQLAQRLSVAQIDELLPPLSAPPVPIADYAAMYRNLGITAAQADAVASLATAFPEIGSGGLGSNNWVIAGSRTASGKPLLANDPHLSLNVPAIWYLARIEADGLQLQGATLPGLPYIVLGRNQHVAWGFTNTGPDVQDLYLERFNPADPNAVLGPKGLESMQLVLETIRIKGERDLPLNVRISPRGPIISDVHEPTRRALGASGFGLSFRWTALDPDNLTVRAGLGLNRARNAQEVEAALRDWAAPMQNVVFADAAGNIGFVAAGRVPKRRSDNDLQGLAPAPAWEPRYDWDGYIPYEQLPREYNPERGYIATANNNILPDAYPFFMTTEWALPFRVQRIAQRIEAVPKHDVASLQAMQADVMSLAMPAWQRVIDAQGGLKPQTELGRRAWAMLQGFDGDMRADRPEPLIWNAWLAAAGRRLLAGRLGGAQAYDRLFGRRDLLAGLLLMTRNGSALCDDPATPQKESCIDALSAAFDAAMADVAKAQGGDPARWRWGDAHQARSEHRPFGKQPLLARLFDLRVPSPGDTYTINVGKTAQIGPEPLSNVHAPSLRAIYDLSSPQAAWMMHSTGQGGNRLLAHYGDFVERWAQVRYIDLAASGPREPMQLTPQPMR